MEVTKKGKNVKYMSLLYVVEDGAQIGIDGGVMKVTHKDKTVTKVPKETVEAINIYGNSQLSNLAREIKSLHKSRKSGKLVRKRKSP